MSLADVRKQRQVHGIARNIWPTNANGIANMHDENENKKQSIWASGRIRQARIDAGLTQAEASREFGITKQYLGAVENSWRRPSEDLILRMSVVYNRPVIYFLAKTHLPSSAIS